MITVDVIVPTYDSGGLLTESLDSIAAQTVHPQRIIVVDDGSTDGTVDPAVAGRANLTLLRQPNRGLAVTTNNGVAECSSDTFLILDHDDLLAPNAIAVLTAAMNENDVQMVHGMVHEFVDARGGLPEGVRMSETTVPARLAGCTLVRRDLWDRIGGCDPSLAQGLWIDWIDRAAAAGATTINVPEVILHRRIHARNFTRSGAGRAQYLDVVRAALARKKDAGNP